MIEDVESEDWDAPPVDFSHDNAAPCPGCIYSHPSADIDNNPTPSKSRCVAIEEVEDKDKTFFHSGRYFEPRGDAGWAKTFERHRRYQKEEGEHAWVPFKDTQNHMKVLFQNNHSFLQRVDNLPHGPGWSCRKVTVWGNLEDDNGVPLQENVELWSWDLVECVKELINIPLFKVDMVYSPARAYVDCVGQHRVIDEMWTADWWSETQTSAQAMILIGYLPAGKFDCFTPNAHLLARYRLFYHCMALLLHSLIATGQDGIEMCLVSCFKENHCPKCNRLNSVICDPESMKEILERCKNSQHPLEFEENSLHAVHKPFWADMPHCSIFLAFTPDLLHKLHKGVFKDHLVKWCVDIVGEEEMDVHFKVMPDYPGLCHFKKGILAVKQWTSVMHGMQLIP
ncbi:hypothetical protein DFJ58DRAFT_713775 [Suillus subalutaceus]|uniref:uncharacterized protein n=1 Tax=Suillus subalutaceus TaxID=48586 RepID=UPI001B87A561|nr:uncharacterized protein DFJ58DRAFT_713775 [Suillus subalutaceus]KAG1871825.1 hypothetical protein DFJ58DRAFT_713775 [Suillus subalutaceus]